MNFSNNDRAVIADMLISYHMHSFRVRREKIFDIEYPPPLVEELENARERLGSRYTEEEKVRQAISFREVISYAKNKVSILAAEAKESGSPQEQYAEADKLMEQISGASYLLELL